MTLDPLAIETLLARVLASDEGAWKSLWSTIEPHVLAVASRRKVMGQLSESEDERRDIVVKVMTRLREDEFRRLRAYAASPERTQGSFVRWLSAVTVRVAIDHVRSHAEYTGRTVNAPRDGHWIRRAPDHEISLLLGNEVAADDAASARLVLARARTLLSEEQRAALGMWLEGHDTNAIARSLGLENGGAADRCVRSALKRLRDRYRSPREESNDELVP